MVALQYTETKYLLKVSEAANMLGLSVYTVYRLIEQGKLQCKRLSVRKTLIPASEIERYVNEHQRKQEVAYAYNKGDSHTGRSDGDFENWQEYFL